MLNKNTKYYVASTCAVKIQPEGRKSMLTEIHPLGNHSNVLLKNFNKKLKTKKIIKRKKRKKNPKNKEKNEKKEKNVKRKKKRKKG